MPWHVTLLYRWYLATGWYVVMVPLVVIRVLMMWMQQRRRQLCCLRKDIAFPHSTDKGRMGLT